MTRADVVIVVPPFANAAYPALGPSLLASGCRQREISSCVFYANLRLASRIGLDLYQRISSSSPEYLAGEALFASRAFGPDDGPSAVGRVFDGLSGIPSYNGPDLTEAALRAIEPEIGPFLDACVEELLEMEPRVVGFSSVFQQHLASLALAARLKRRRPGVCTVLGGGNAAAPMGQATEDLTSTFDHIFCGEADFEFPRFCQVLVERGERPPSVIIDCEPISDLDTVEVPDFRDYFEQLPSDLHRGTPSPPLPEVLPFETSRGCWYGAKHHCTFCGLNGFEIGYRRKSSRRILDEMRGLARAYGQTSLYAVDNIMPRHFVNEVLPTLAKREVPLEVYFEVKANLRAEELDLFVLGGVTHIQAGIESLSTSVLKLMDKGVTARQCIVLLVECLSRQIDVRWNVIFGFPGESRDEYVKMLRVIPLLEHLQPPIGFGPIRIDRFSPYQQDPERYGIGPLEPLPAYAKVYPSHARIMDLAYSFVGRYDTEFTRDRALVSEYCSALLRWGRQWERAQVMPRLWRLPGTGEEIVLEDTRSCAARRHHRLDPTTLAVLEWLRHPVRRDRLDPPSLAAIEPLLEANVVIDYDDHLLSLLINPAHGLELRRNRGRIDEVPASMPLTLHVL